MTAFPKFTYIRSKKILEACRQIPCQHCGANDGTVVAAHSNHGIHGKGRSVKSSDVYVAALCAICHHQIDQGFLFTREEKSQIWHRAHSRTIRLLVALGLWPTNISVPNVEFFSPHSQQNS